MTDFELDRTSSGKVKINVVSLANLVAIIALLTTAIGTWNSMVNQVNMIGFRVDTVSKELVQMQVNVRDNLIARDADFREVRARTETITTRLSIVETQLNNASSALAKVDQKIDKLLLK